MIGEGKSLHVVGAGLIGTSIALGAVGLGYEVSIEDVDSSRELLARDLLGIASPVEIAPSFVIVAVTPNQTASAVSKALKTFPESIVIDVTSAKTKVIADVLELSENIARFIPTHPIAGREVGGPASARGDLFAGRPWVVTPLRENAPDAVAAFDSFASALGASVLRMTPDEHDRVFARISHLPQLVSTLVSASLHEVGERVSIAGQGLRDVTRLADSSGELWGQIITQNSTEIGEALKSFAGRIMDLQAAIAEVDEAKILSIFTQGNVGRQLFAGKHGGVRRDYVLFRIVVEDKPGVLADLFLLCGEKGINIEDLSMEHSPNQETGLITLAINPSQEVALRDALTAADWRFHLDQSKS